MSVSEDRLDESSEPPENDGRFLASVATGRKGKRVGFAPHVRRLAGKVFSPRGAKGLVREVVGLGTHIALYPFGLSGTALRDNGATPSSDTFELPVILVHGYFHNRSGFFFMARRLRAAGFRWVYAMNYNPIGASIQSLAAQLGREVDDVKRVTGAPKVHVVGHSLGGVIARWYAQEMGGDENIDHCVTIGTPHHGTYAAYFGMGEAAAQMRPGSELLERLKGSFGSCDTKWVNLYSDLDVLIVPPTSAKLPATPNVTNQLIRDLGHTSLLVSGELINVVTSALANAEVSTPLAEVRPFPSRSGAREQSATGR